MGGKDESTLGANNMAYAQKIAFKTKTSLTHHVKIMLLIRESVENRPVRGSGLIVSIMFKTMTM